MSRMHGLEYIPIEFPAELFPVNREGGFFDHEKISVVIDGIEINSFDYREASTGWKYLVSAGMHTIKITIDIAGRRTEFEKITGNKIETQTTLKQMNRLY
jgi:hypothetical protein